MHRAGNATVIIDANVNRRVVCFPGIDIGMLVFSNMGVWGVNHIWLRFKTNSLGL